VLAGSKDSNRCIGYLTKYLTKHVADCATGTYIKSQHTRLGKTLPPPAHRKENIMRVKEAFAEAACQAAVRYLEGCGFRVLDRNWRCGSEIISIIAADRRVLVVVDLRVRAGTRHGAPLEVIGTTQQQTLRRLAARWLAAHGLRFDQIRIDAMGLLQETAGGFTIEHVRAVG
jgi:putative endonuclease